MRLRVAFLLAALMLVCSFSLTGASAQVQGECKSAVPPPGTIAINDTLYADQGEALNVDYREYLYYLGRAYGTDSPELREALPDTTVWEAVGETVAYGGWYFWDSATSYHPVVGVTQLQAIRFLAWRTDRVAELALIKCGAITPYPDATRDDLFTVDRYRKGQYVNTVELVSFVAPVYRLPTPAEWGLIAGVSDTEPYGTDSGLRQNRRLVRRNGGLFHDAQALRRSQSESGNKPRTRPSLETARNRNGLCGTVANVREWVANPGVARGSDWTQKLTPETFSTSHPVVGADARTGFRAVAQMYRFEPAKTTVRSTGQ